MPLNKALLVALVASGLALSAACDMRRAADGPPQHADSRLLLDGAPAGSSGTEPSERHDPEAQAVLEEYARAYMQRDVDAMVALYAPNAILLPPGQDIVRGADSIRAFWARGSGTPIQFDIFSAVADLSGGYVVGRYTLPASGSIGHFTVTLTRVTNGRLLIVSDIWNVVTR